MVMDIRTAKVDNGWILFSMFLGLSGCIWQKGIAGICSFAVGSVVPLLLIILFLFGMMGAGDIKLFCALGGSWAPEPFQDVSLFLFWQVHVLHLYF